MPLRIGIVCPYSLTVPGGVQAQVLGLGRELRRRGYEVRVLGPCDGPPPESFVTPLGNSIPTASNGSIAPIAPDASAVLRTIRALHDESFDIVHLHEPMVPGPTATALLLHSAPTVATFHRSGSSTGYRLLEPLMRRVAHRIERRVVVSKDALELAEQHFGGEYTVLFNGVDVHSIQSVAPRPTDGPTVFFCGRHEPRKGLDVLIEAFEHLDVPAHLWIASDGPDTDRLQQRTRNDSRIEWLGRISEEDKFARLRGADVFCAPSLGGESFGVVLIEAMAAGAVVVASALDGYRNVATDRLDSLLVEPGDQVALTAALRSALIDRDASDLLRQAGSERAGCFDMRTLVDRYLEIYGELLTAT